MMADPGLRTRSGTRAGARAGTRAGAVRPSAYPFQQWTIAVLVLMAPIFSVLYWLTVPTGTWLPVALTQAVLTVLLCLGVLSYYLTAMWADASGLTKRDLLGRRHVFPVERIGGAVRLELSRSGSLSPQPPLFLLDTDGRLLTRMHVLYWPSEAMDAVTDALGVAVARDPEPLTLRELSRSRPELLHWFERRFVAHTVDD
jgi:hypothetical protein